MKIKYKFEAYPNPDFVGIHVGVKLTQESYVTLNTHCGKDEKARALITLLQSVPGVVEASIGPYQVNVKVAAAFERQEVAANCVEILKGWCALEGISNSDDEWDKGRPIAKYIQCAACAEKSRRMEKEYSGLGW